MLDQERPVAAAPEVEDVAEQDERAAVDRVAGLEELEKRRNVRVGVARVEVRGDEDHEIPWARGRIKMAAGISMPDQRAHIPDDRPEDSAHRPRRDRRPAARGSRRGDPALGRADARARPHGPRGRDRDHGHDRAGDPAGLGHVAPGPARVSARGLLHGPRAPRGRGLGDPHAPRHDRLPGELRDPRPGRARHRPARRPDPRDRAALEGDRGRRRPPVLRRLLPLRLGRRPPRRARARGHGARRRGRLERPEARGRRAHAVRADDGPARGREDRGGPERVRPAGTADPLQPPAQPRAARPGPAAGERGAAPRRRPDGPLRAVRRAVRPRRGRGRGRDPDHRDRDRSSGSRRSASRARPARSTRTSRARSGPSWTRSRATGSCS